MASTIVTKNSSTASAVPLTGDLTQGELAVNVTDKRLFTKNSGGTVVELGTNPASLALPNGTANGVAYLNGSKVVTTGSALTFDGTNLGVGLTPSGSFRLEIGGADGTQFALRSTGTTAARIRGYVNSAEAGVIGFLNGGGQYFEVAGSEQMRLTSTGLGIGTSSPGFKLQVSRSGAGTSALFGGGAGLQTIKIGYDAADSYRIAIGYDISQEYGYLQAYAASSTTYDDIVINPSGGNLGLGVTPSAWSGTNTKALDISLWTSLANGNAFGSALTFNGYYNGTSWIYKQINSASKYESDGAHRWYTAPSGTAGNAITFTQAMTLLSSGALVIGDTSVVASGFAGVKFNGASYNGLGLNDSSSTSGVGFIYFQSNGTTIGSITRVAATSAVAYNTVSDQRLKENIADADDASALIDSIQVRKYNWKADGSHQRYGFVAQELVTVAPEAVHQPTDPDEMMAVDYSKLVPMLVKEIQSLRQRVAQLEGK